MSITFAINIPTSAGVGGHKDHPYWEQATWSDIRCLAESAESVGFDTIGVPDHLTIGEGKTFECFTTLAALAMVTNNVTLYPKVTNVLFRNPGLLAKMAACIDVVSGGRLKMGVGAGWVDSEMRAYGYDWPEPVTRIQRMEETIEILKLLWTDESVDYRGQFYRLQSVTCRPKPKQTPRPPIAVGGGGERHTLKVVASHADSWNWIGPFDEWPQKRDILGKHCETVGRDIDEIEKSWFGRAVVRRTEDAVNELVDTASMFDSLVDAKREHLVGTPEQVIEQIERLKRMGIDEVVVEFIDIPETTGMDLFADEVMPAFR